MPLYLMSVHGTQTDAGPAAPRGHATDVRRRRRLQPASCRQQGNWVFAGGPLPAGHRDRRPRARTARPCSPTARTPRPRSTSAASGSSGPTDLDQAVELAARGSAACRGPVEVRPIQDEPIDELRSRSSDARVACRARRPTRSAGSSARSPAGRVATLVRVFGDIDIAEEAVQEAFVAATTTWPTTGLPPNPGAWITTTARNRAIDRLRREAKRHHRQVEAALLQERSRLRRPRPAGGGARAGRPAPPDLHLLPPGAGPAHPGGADPAPGRPACRPRRSRGRSWCPNPRWPSAWCGPSARSRRRRIPIRVPTTGSSRTGSGPCSPSSTWSSTRGTPRRAGRTWSATTCARRRCGWPGCCTSSCPTSPRRWGCSHCCC